MNGDNIYSELLNLELNSKVNSLKDFISKVDYLIDWERFGKIPHRPSTSNLIRYCIDLFNIRLRKQYSFLLSSPIHHYLFKRLCRQTNAQTGLLFKFLCLNAQIEESLLYDILNRDEINNYVRCGLFIKHNDKIFLPFTILPYRNYYYLSDSKYIIENRNLYGIGPAHIGHPTHLQVIFLKNMLKDKHILRMLEMGSGIGIITIEMCEFVKEREGAEIYKRNIEFSLANKELRNDENVRFYQSDLFSNVKGKFDLISFNPWQPRDGGMPVIRKFLEQAPFFLTKDGNIFLLIYSNNIVLDEIAQILHKNSMIASNTITNSFYLTEQDGNISLYTSNFLWIEHLKADKHKKLKRVIQTRRNLKWAVFIARRLLKSMYSCLVRRKKFKS